MDWLLRKDDNRRSRRGELRKVLRWLREVLWLLGCRGPGVLLLKGVLGVSPLREVQRRRGVRLLRRVRLLEGELLRLKGVRLLKHLGAGVRGGAMASALGFRDDVAFVFSRLVILLGARLQDLGRGKLVKERVSERLREFVPAQGGAAGWFAFCTSGLGCSFGRGRFFVALLPLRLFLTGFAWASSNTKRSGWLRLREVLSSSGAGGSAAALCFRALSRAVFSSSLG